MKKIIESTDAEMKSTNVTWCVLTVTDSVLARAGKRITDEKNYRG